jgi:hypothetical protein
MMLPQIQPRFYVPPLPDKPQNPIIDGLKFVSFHTADVPNVLPPELLVLTDLAKVPTDSKLWVHPAKRKGPHRVSFQQVECH